MLKVIGYEFKSGVISQTNKPYETYWIYLQEIKPDPLKNNDMLQGNRCEMIKISKYNFDYVSSVPISDILGKNIDYVAYDQRGNIQRLIYIQ